MLASTGINVTLPGTFFFLNQENFYKLVNWVKGKGIVSDSNNKFLCHESEDFNKKKKKKKKTISKISVDSSFTFTSNAWLCALAVLHRLLLVLNLVSSMILYMKIALILHWHDFCLIPLGECASWGRATNRLRNSNLKIFESAVYMKSGSMCLWIHFTKVTLKIELKLLMMRSHWDRHLFVYKYVILELVICKKVTYLATWGHILVYY